jgi:hypothetical protein
VVATFTGFDRRQRVPPAADRPAFFPAGRERRMADEFDPDKFEEKYVHYFTELQRAYKNAFNQMNERYDSELIHGIDQMVLNESEPMYEDGEFHVELPESPRERLDGVLVDDEKFEATLEEYVDRIESELYRTLGVEPPE